MKGSIAGLVFFKSGSGIVARMKNGIIRNDSIAVKQSRLLFAASFDGWNQLTAVQKSNWDSWAITNYSSATHPSGHSTNGYNAYRGVYTQIQNFLSKVLSFTMTEGPNLTSRSYSQTAFDFTILPSLQKVNNSLLDTGYPSKILYFSSCQVDHAGQANFVVTYNTPPVLLTASQQFKNTSGVKFGFLVYLSEPGNSPGFIAKNKLRNCIFSTGLFSVLAPFITNTSSMKFSFDCSSLLAKTKYNIQSGKYYLMSVFVVGENGTSSFVGSRNVLVT